MGTQHQTPGSQSQQSGTRQQTDEQSKRAKSKPMDAGNVPKSDDDIMDEASEGTREDGAGPASRNS